MPIYLSNYEHLCEFIMKIYYLRQQLFTSDHIQGPPISITQILPDTTTTTAADSTCCICVFVILYLHVKHLGTLILRSWCQGLSKCRINAMKKFDPVRVHKRGSGGGIACGRPEPIFFKCIQSILLSSLLYGNCYCVFTKLQTMRRSEN